MICVCKMQSEKKNPTILLPCLFDPHLYVYRYKYANIPFWLISRFKPSIFRNLFLFLEVEGKGRKVGIYRL